MGTALYLLLFFTVVSAEAAPDTVTVTLEARDSLRQLAQQYLGDPNEWETILRYNGYSDIRQITARTEIRIPVKAYRDASRQIENASRVIQEANLEGAGVLAKAQIGQSIQLKIRAAGLKKAGKLDESEKTATQAIAAGQQALEIARQKKIRSVSAVLFHKQGSVQSRKSEELLWNEAIINQELEERERVRTLASSLGEILFIDGSNIRLEENSLAVIGTMKENVLKKSSTTDVTVLEGDVLVHLASLSKRKKFTVTSPGIGANIRSRKFRTSRDNMKVTRIANYDGEIDVSSKGSSVTLKKNQGTKIKAGDKPQAPRKLLLPPKILSPLPNQVFLSKTVRFKWETVSAARYYKLEISRKRDFSHLSQTIKTETSEIEWQVPEDGIYYYRAYAIDNDAFSGPFSEVFDFYVGEDKSPPYLAVHHPVEGQTVLSEKVSVRGVVESKAVLQINGRKVQQTDTGAFDHFVRLKPGRQAIRITATDHAGNTTTVVRNLICNLDDRMIWLQTPNPMHTNSGKVTLTGKVRPKTRVEINGNPVNIEGQFSYLLTLPEGSHVIEIKGVSPGDDIQTIPLHITVDLTPPEILPDAFPSYTNQKQLSISGKVSEDVSFFVNQTAVDITERRYRIDRVLKQGKNVFELMAVDNAGNRTTKQLTTFLDTQGPKIDDYRFSRPAVTGGQIIELIIRADDDGVGLSRTGRFSFIVKPGKNEFNGMLTLNDQSDGFTGNVFVPPGIKGEPVITMIVIKDRLGNETIVP